MCTGHGPAGWPVIVTIIGWLLVIGGVIRLMLPATTATLAGDIYANPVVLLIVAIVVLVVGAFLRLGIPGQTAERTEHDESAPGMIPSASMPDMIKMEPVRMIRPDKGIPR